MSWILLGYALPWLRGFVGQPVITDRNTIMLVVPLLLLAGYGLAVLPFVWLQRSLLIALSAYSIYFLVLDLHYYERIKKNQFRETAAAMGSL